MKLPSTWKQNNEAAYVFFILAVCTITSFGQTAGNTKIENTKPFVPGVIDEIQSAELAETRILNIYLPEGTLAGGLNLV